MMSSITSNIVSPTTRQPYSIVIGMMIQPQIKTQLQQLLGEVILKSVKTGETVIVSGNLKLKRSVLKLLTGCCDPVT